MFVLFRKKNYKKTRKKNLNPTGWGAGQPGFPCKDGVNLFVVLFSKKNGATWVSLLE